ncbi:uncharacterized protein K02A2.6-like [Uranotaenia lowii]|uniref:uncharacterized protein K02A2.6-like n=1 Tax=Uranotaenia lowii TaxID=190385 RepID=UPI002479CFE8|nr:uncharacterized protein K02A2.6-like [Uranotaenia lowii]
MDHNQFKVFIDQQARFFQQLVQSVSSGNGSRGGESSTQQPCASGVSVPLPSPLALDGDMAENYDLFERSWQEYASAIGMDQWPDTDNKKKVSFLLSVIGEPARKKFFNFELTEEQKVNPEAALRAIKALVVPKRNLIVDRLDFFGAMQFSGESANDFCSRLKMLAKLARLGDLATELVTFKLVTSNKWSHLRTKLLTITDVTLEKAMDLCRAEEIASSRAVELGAGNQQSEVNKIKKSKEKPEKLPLCKFCGDHHEFIKGKCPAFGKRCTKCGGKNHYRKVCKSNDKSKSRRFKKVKEVKNSDTEESDSDSNCETSSQESEAEYEIGKVYDNSKTGGSVLAELDLKFNKKWKAVMCDLDTGANTSLIGHDCLVKLSCDSRPAILPTKFRLQGFGGNPIKVIGQIKVPCRRRDRKFILVLQVVEGDHRPLLSAKASRELGFVKFCQSVSFTEPTANQVERLLNIYRIEAQGLVNEYSNLFIGYGRLPGEVSLEVDSSITPSIQPPRRVPIAVRDKLKKEIEMLEKDGIIVKVNRHTEWVSNLVIVQRGGPDSGVRICLDPVPLNKALKRPNLQFVTLDEILPELGKAKVFSTVDARKGFWHVMLDEASSKLTTFWTPFGRYRWTRLPFGIAPAPEIFQIKLQEVIQGLKGVECIADDLLIYGAGDSLEEALINHNENLKQLFCRLEQHNVKLNKSKLKLCERSIKFYGHILTDQGLQPDNDKITAIRNYPTPSNRKEWTTVEQEEFEKVKALVSNSSTLKYYDITQPLTIECDAKRNYAQIEKELLAILFACVRFDQLIVGNPKATVKTDHKPLIAIFKKPLLSAPRRLQHMLLNLQRYNLSVEFVTGKENVVADALSRASTASSDLDCYKKNTIYKIFKKVENVKLSSFLSVSDSKIKEIIEQTENDPTMQLILRYIQNGWPVSVDQVPDSVRVYFSYHNELSTQDGLIFRNDRIVVPHILRRNLIDSCHTSHNGIEATLKLARSNLFWPGMSSQIKDVVQQCTICAKYAPSQSNPPMLSHDIPVHPFQLVSMDVFFAEYKGAKRNFLITVDHYSDFFELNILKDLTPDSVIASCKENFSRHGVPQRVVCDNATNFTSQKMVKFSLDWDFQLVSSAPYHQQANGKSEAAVKIAKRLLKKAEESGTDCWYALLHWRNIPNKVGSSPATRLFSRSTRCGVPVAAERLCPKVVENVPPAIEKNRKKAKYYYDKKSKPLPELQKGAPVHVQLRPDTSKTWSPGTIANRLNDRSYLVNVDGVDYRRSLVHLKPRKEPETPPLSLPSTVPNPSEAVYHNPKDSQPNSYTRNDDFADGQTQHSEKQPTALFTRNENTSPAESSKMGQPPTSTEKKTQAPRPKRIVRAPAKLKDYDLDF